MCERCARSCACGDCITIANGLDRADDSEIIFGGTLSKDVKTELNSMHIMPKGMTRVQKLVVAQLIVAVIMTASTCVCLIYAASVCRKSRMRQAKTAKILKDFREENQSAQMNSDHVRLLATDDELEAAGILGEDVSVNTKHGDGMVMGVGLNRVSQDQHMSLSWAQISRDLYDFNFDSDKLETTV